MVGIRAFKLDIERLTPQLAAEGGIRLPGIHCPRCGGFSSNARLRVHLTARARKLIDQEDVLPLDRWRAFQQELAAELGVPADVLLPDMQIGDPAGVLLRGELPPGDILSPAPGQFWVTPRFEAAARGLSGAALAELKLCRPRGSAVRVDLKELVALGDTRTVSYDAWLRRGCPCCGSNGAIDWPPVVDSRTLRTDFGMLDKNPGIMVLSERAATTLGEACLDNLELIPLAVQES